MSSDREPREHPVVNLLPVPVSQLMRMLAEAGTVMDLLNVRDVAQRVRDVLRVRGRGSKEELVQAAACAVRTERRLGELLLGMKKNRGTLLRGDTMSPRGDEPTYAELGLAGDGGKKTAERCQAIARIPRGEFEEHLNQHLEAVKEATTAYFLRLARPYLEDGDGFDDEPEEAQSGGYAAIPNEISGTLADSLEEDRPPLVMPRGLVLGNCLDLLPTFPSESADLVTTDPPYNNGTNYGSGPQADRLPDHVFLGNLRHSMAECYRILKPDGTLWVMMADEYADYLGLILREVGFHRRAWVKWYETFGVCNSARNNFSRSSRHLFYCVKDPERFMFDPRPVMKPSDRQKKYKDKRANPRGKVWDDVWGIDPPIPRLTGTCKERLKGFPTQLPLALVEAIILACSRRGAVVLDPYAGSATTGVASYRHGREYLGIEIDERSYRRALGRLRKEGSHG
jgi:site-specific DNA-methyltransferase (adenine-specific)